MIMTRISWGQIQWEMKNGQGHLEPQVGNYLKVLLELQIARMLLPVPVMLLLTGIRRDGSSKRILLEISCGKIYWNLSVDISLTNIIPTQDGNFVACGYYKDPVPNRGTSFCGKIDDFFGDSSGRIIIISWPECFTTLIFFR